MHLLYCDETNLEYRQGDFFAYGGISVEANSALNLSRDLDALRRDFNLNPSHQLKFNPGPPDLTHQQFINLKQQTIELAIQHGAKFFSSLILHDIATSPDNARRNEINRVCYHFDSYLDRVRSHGLVLIDRFNDNQIDAHLIEKFSIGIVGLPYTPIRRLERIIGFHYSAIGQSHVSSIIDIVLGSFRFCINSFTRNDPAALARARIILPILSPIFLYDERTENVSDLSLFFSPRDVQVQRYQEKYTGLKGFLRDNGIRI